MSKLPSTAISLPRGVRPPEFCPECLKRRARKPWLPLPEGLRQWYIDKGHRPLAQCSGCMGVLVEVEEVPAR